MLIIRIILTFLLLALSIGQAMTIVHEKYKGTYVVELILSILFVADFIIQDLYHLKTQTHETIAIQSYALAINYVWKLTYAFFGLGYWIPRILFLAGDHIFLGVYGFIEGEYFWGANLVVMLGFALLISFIV